MVEEMYMEETKGNDKENSDDKTSLSEINGTNWNQMDSPTGPGASPGNISTVLTAMSSLGNLRTAAGFGLIESSSPDAHIQLLDNESVIKQATPKRTINNGLQGFVPFPTDESVKPSEGVNFAGFTITDRHGRPGYGFSDGLGAYQIDDVSRYNHDTFTPRINNNGVSLTLGLPHCDSVLSLSGAQSPYLPSPNMQLGRTHELGSEPANEFCTLNPVVAALPAATAAHSPNGYENLHNIHASRKRFAAQLLPDFVT